ncbi:MAG: UDP-N-acetylmuramoyl-L-alanyl-D-glutamate--2,6-diaminopimelate ligase [Actinobacteria bacterium]|jgi:UDP-N-acetylmuramoyl-L-alanyl-D-glutamate--2,6-diaminopimelate ligase|nr:UDP-N-acetylmuramoyl-L-alanyl-D-glutamate--2,6-diaminopimelate ligase [Actinomycetota bacterium]MCL6095272.1 UDP-N-acetylmuramoyl-L-alanyl-D-glutamate--2,6-diaminopimelate ligase [Actinomycetota bacterium]
MLLSELLSAIDVREVHGSIEQIEVTSICYSSSDATSGSLFCCLVGARADGHDFAVEATYRGAVAVVCDHAVPVEVPQILVDRSQIRQVMAQLSAKLWGYPSKALRVVGVTGTNGKTTVCHMIKSILDANGCPSMTIGTLSGSRTTPEAPDLQRTLSMYSSNGGCGVAMEVSSHGLAQHRVDGTRFEVVCFTNLSRDHLDFHGSLENYYQAKASLFSPEFSDIGVVCVDDDWGRRLLEQAKIDMVPFSVQDVSDVNLQPSGISFRWRGHAMRVPLVGMFNLSNAVAAASVASVMGFATEGIAAGLAGMQPVPGRFEVVVNPPPFLGIVDYAHTPDGLRAALISARSMTGERGRVIVVFGCGGERDHGKRSMMGQVATTLADVTVITSDNPRSEDPVSIAREILAGAVSSANVIVELDRREAIRSVAKLAGPNDVVLVAGKGHETTLELSSGSVPFVDSDELAEAARNIES